MASELPTYHGFTETEFVGLYFCLFERPDGLLFGVAPMSIGMPDCFPLQEYEAVARALKGFRRGEGLSKLSATKALPPPLTKRKWKVKSYAVNDYSDLKVSKVTTAKGDLVGWFAAAHFMDAKPSTYVALHEPKFCPAVYEASVGDDEDTQTALEWEQICQFKDEWETARAEMDSPYPLK